MKKNKAGDKLLDIEVGIAQAGPDSAGNVRIKCPDGSEKKIDVHDGWQAISLLMFLREFGSIKARAVDVAKLAI